MILLLDTNALLWLVLGDSALGPKARERIEAASRICISDVALLEISIKAAKRKLEAPAGLGTLVDQLGIVRIGIRDKYLDMLRELPLHHKDPFDRYLIAQALVDSSTVVTSDPAFAQYGVRVIDARV